MLVVTIGKFSIIKLEHIEQMRNRVILRENDVSDRQTNEAVAKFSVANFSFGKVDSRRLLKRA